MYPKVGDYVLVRPIPVEETTAYEDSDKYFCGWVSGMENFVGSVCKVTKVCKANYGAGSSGNGEFQHSVVLCMSKFSIKMKAVPDEDVANIYFFCLRDLELLPDFEDLE